MKESIPTGTKTLLLVDNDEYLIFGLMKLIIKEGYNVIRAKDGTQAVEVYKSKSNDIDIVLMDISMCVVDDIEAYIKILKVDKKTPILLMSTNSLTTSEDFTSPYFIRKPLSPNELIKRINDISTPHQLANYPQ